MDETGAFLMSSPIKLIRLWRGPGQRLEWLLRRHSERIRVEITRKAGLVALMMFEGIVCYFNFDSCRRGRKKPEFLVGIMV